MATSIKIASEQLSSSLSYLTFAYQKLRLSANNMDDGAQRARIEIIREKINDAIHAVAMEHVLFEEAHSLWSEPFPTARVL